MDFKESLDERLTFINKIIEEYTPFDSGYLSKICEAVKYSLNAGGKRLRPLILMESFRLCKGDGKYNESDIYAYMAALEMIHTYSLVHDDLPAMDNDLLRRGLPTTHAKFGEDFGILAGDALLNAAYELMTEKLCEKPEKRFAQAAFTLAKKAGIFGMVGGQCLDVELTGKTIDKEQLDFIFSYKTGALIEASFMAGGILAGAGEEEVQALEKTGSYLGRAFQIRDDILDMTGTDEEIGKPVGSDERNNKTTYVTLYGLEKANEDVAKYSKEAISILKGIGENDFLFELINNLVSRRS